MYHQIKIRIMHETPRFGTRPSARAKWIHPWQQEHFNQTRISPFSLARCLQPCANEIFSYTKTRFTDQCSQTKMLLTICSSSWWNIRATCHPHPLLPRWHQVHPTCPSSWGWVDPSRSRQARLEANYTTSNPLEDPSRLEADGPIKWFLLYWWRGVRDWNWKSVPDW